MKYAYAKHFRTLTEFTVKNIYPFYLSGGIRVAGKFQGRTFKYDEDGKIMEQVWNGSEMELVEPTGKVWIYEKFQKEDEDGNEGRSYEADFKDAFKDKHFYRTYKKVFDVALSLPKAIDIETTKKGDDGDYIVESTDEVVIKGLGRYKVQEMLRSDFSFIVPTDDQDREKFDWEDDFYKTLVGKTFQMRVTGTGFDTKYQFSPQASKTEEMPAGFEEA